MTRIGSDMISGWSSLWVLLVNLTAKAGTPGRRVRRENIRKLSALGVLCGEINGSTDLATLDRETTDF
jgi:hypothetical protein